MAMLCNYNLYVRKLEINMKMELFCWIKEMQESVRSSIVLRCRV